MGGGVLTGKPKSLAGIKDDLFHTFGFPLFQPGGFEANIRLVEQVEEMTKTKSCTPTQLAINWTRAVSNRSEMPSNISILGATTVERVNENSKMIDLTDDEMARIDAVLANSVPAGGRCTDAAPIDN